jgi:hypothetical protein
MSNRRMTLAEARAALDQHRLESARAMIAEQQSAGDRPPCGVYTPDPRYPAVGSEYRVPCACGSPSCLPAS